MAAKDIEARRVTPRVLASLTVKFDHMGITNPYANVCNVSSSREASEVRVILSPFETKWRALLLDHAIKQYETRFGVMDVGTVQASADRSSAQ
jgi:hypothetical protein